MGRVMGIDLGTTNSVVALVEAEVPEIIINVEGAKTTPSVVHWPEGDGEVVVGELARRQEIMNPTRTVRSIKRFMGCRWDESADKREDIPYEAVPTETGMVGIQIDDRVLTPEEISSHILSKMRQSAEAHTDESMTQAVITVPAYFNDSQRQATKAAAELAGLTVLRIINEPTAAALSYGLGRESHEIIAVFDLGGGTFDISLLEIEGGVIEVRATAGDNNLGGDLFDRLITDWLCDAIDEETGIDPRGNLQSVQRVREAAERAKCELSTLTETMINLPFVVADDDGPKHFDTTISRDQLEEIITPLFDRIVKPCKQALRDANLMPGNISTVLLVGGSSRIPSVQALAQEIFDRDPVKSINPDEVVAAGAAIQASILSGEIQEVLLLDVTPLSLGIELEGGVFKPLIPRNSSIPTTTSHTFTTVQDNQRAVRIHVLQGERKIANENRSLGRFRLTGIPPQPREVPEIEVTFNIDPNGILNVSAEDLTSGTRQDVIIEAIANLSSSDIERMIDESEKYASEDREFIEQVEMRERAAVIRDQFAEFIETCGDEITPEDLAEMEDTLETLTSVTDAGDPIGIEENVEIAKRLMQPYSDLLHLSRAKSASGSKATSSPPVEAAPKEDLTEDPVGELDNETDSVPVHEIDLSEDSEEVAAEEDSR